MGHVALHDRFSVLLIAARRSRRPAVPSAFADSKDKRTTAESSCFATRHTAREPTPDGVSSDNRLRSCSSQAHSIDKQGVKICHVQKDRSA
jgi:hypothetical protein